MTISIDIDRLSISLRGVSPGVAEAAMVGLDDELRRRLGNLVPRALVSGDLGVLRLGSIAGSASTDPGALRNLIADRLVDALRSESEEA